MSKNFTLTRKADFSAIKYLMCLLILLSTASLLAQAPAIAWQKFMAYAHTGVEIQPVFGVDFAIEPTIVADTDPTLEEEVVQRPPSLTPGAARKLVDLADLLAVMIDAPAQSNQASVAAPVATQGL